MNTTTWLFRSLRFHRRMHLALACGAALATAVLAAALLTGEALNRNLQRMALERVGGIRSAVELRGRFVDASLAERLAKETGAHVAPVLRLPASVLAVDDQGAETRVDRVNAYGVDERFFALGGDIEKSRGRDRAPTEGDVTGMVEAPPSGAMLLSGKSRGRDRAPTGGDVTGMVGAPLRGAMLLSGKSRGRDRAPTEGDVTGNVGAPPRGAMLLSLRVQDALGAASNAAISLRFEQPSAFPSEMPLSDRHGEHVLRRPVRVCGLLPDAQLGRFALVASQIPPLNAFVNRTWLSGEAGLSNRVNLLLSDAAPKAFEAALRAAWQPADVGLRVSIVNNGVQLVQSDRIYLDEATTRALSACTQAPVLTLHHLVDAFVAGEGAAARETPYGFITAETPVADARLGVVPVGMRDDEIVINAWLAEKLRLHVGDELTLRWRRMESGGRLVPDAALFRVKRVIDMSACAQERLLFPHFPGLSDADQCADWDVGLAMDKDKLNDPDNEAYWKAYGPTPRAFVTLAAGRLMLGTHFGSAMTARFAPEIAPESIQSVLRQADPRALGFVVRPVQQEALQAAGQAMDFRLLFTGMASVLMIAALLLTGLLASLGVALRREEVGVLRTAGFSARQVMFLWVAETLPALLAGVVAGVCAGVGGARLLVWGVNRFWSQAVASAQVPFTVGWESCAWAAGLALLLSLLVVGWGVRRAMRMQVRDLLGSQDGALQNDAGGRWIICDLIVGMGATLVAITLLALSGRVTGEAASGIFFGAGLLLMISLLCFARLLVGFFDSTTVAAAVGRDPRPPVEATEIARGAFATGPIRAGLLNVARNRGRSLLVMVLLASGSFLAIGTLAMKQDPAANLGRSWSGSGGFDSMVELSIPMPGDKADAAIRATLEPGASVLPFRVHEGDEAGCLNLNHALQPRLIGVAPEAAAALRAFDQPGVERSAWSLLQHPMLDDTIPVLAGDLTTVEYGLQAQAGVRDGSVYEYTGEDGTVWRLRVVGALPVRTGVLQGSLLIDEATFTRIYPSAAGHGLWLVRSKGPSLATALQPSLGRNGVLVTSTRERLCLLGAVEATYLDMFLVLGGLGVILGAAGVGLVVLRNLAARRGELAVLRVLGVPSQRVMLYLLAEYAYLLLAGMLAGILPALVAVQPAMRSLGQAMPVVAMSVIIVAMAISGLLGVAAAVWAATRMPMLDALRGE